MTISTEDGLNHDVDEMESYILTIARSKGCYGSPVLHDRDDFADVLRASLSQPCEPVVDVINALSARGMTVNTENILKGLRDRGFVEDEVAQWFRAEEVKRAQRKKERADLLAAADEAAPEPAPSRARARL